MFLTEGGEAMTVDEIRKRLDDDDYYLSPPNGGWYRSGCEFLLAEIDRLKAKLAEPCVHDAAKQWLESTIADYEPEMLEMAKKAVESCKARKDENIDEWAQRLANDVANAND